jgi:hypothetical protein
MFVSDAVPEATVPAARAGVDPGTGGDGTRRRRDVDLPAGEERDPVTGRGVLRGHTDDVRGGRTGRADGAVAGHDQHLTADDGRRGGAGGLVAVQELRFVGTHGQAAFPVGASIRATSASKSSSADGSAEPIEPDAITGTSDPSARAPGSRVTISGSRS